MTNESSGRGAIPHRQLQPANFALLKRSRSGAIPEPTVTVRTEEEKHVFLLFCARKFLAGVFVCQKYF